MDAYVEWRRKVGVEYSVSNKFLSVNKSQHRRTIYYRKLLQVDFNPRLIYILLDSSKGRISTHKLIPLVGPHFFCMARILAGEHVLGVVGQRGYCRRVFFQLNKSRWFVQNFRCCNHGMHREDFSGAKSLPKSNLPPLIFHSTWTKQCQFSTRMHIFIEKRLDIETIQFCKHGTRCRKALSNLIAAEIESNNSSHLLTGLSRYLSH